MSEPMPEAGPGSSRLPRYTRAECLGAACLYFAGDACESRMELLAASGQSGSADQAPLRADSSWAVYGHICTGGEGQVAVGLRAESPNGRSSEAGLVARLGQFGGREIVLTTPPEAITYE